MTSKEPARFDPEALRSLAGDKVFARGQAYADTGSVEILNIEPTRVLARVAGTEDYRTEVTGNATAIDGECACPAFERDGFCKHMVAVALVANDGVTSGETEDWDTLGRVRDYLRTKGVDALVEMILGVAERDLALLRKLEIAAAAHGADGENLEPRLRKVIRDATRTHGFVDYRRASEWAAGAEAALDMLAELSSGPRAGLAITLAGEAISRIERASENIDDSDGHCGALLVRAREIHLAACRAARPEPVALARDLFKREMEETYDVFYAAAERYADVLGEQGLAEYRRLAQEAWDALSARDNADRDSGDLVDDFRLIGILDDFAERDGDLETRIALRARNLTSPHAYLRLAEFCHAHGREAEALRFAEEGLWVFEDSRHDPRLVSFAVERLLEADRKADAEAYLWRAFKKAPSLGLYRQLRDLGGEAVSERALQFLEEWLGRETATRWYSPADLLIRIMIEERMFEGAWAAVRQHGASHGVKEELAKASEATHPREALIVYAERVEELAGTGGNPAYEAAAELIARMAGLRDEAAQAAYLADLKGRHGRKRNFMKLLG